MPSPRRIRALFLALVLALGFTFYLTSEMHHNGGGNFYRQTVNAMSSKQNPQTPNTNTPHGSVPVDGRKAAPLKAGEAQETFQKLKPSASEQDKQAIAPDRQFQIEKERKEKEKQAEANGEAKQSVIGDKATEEDAEKKPAQGKGKISTDSEVIDTTSEQDKSTKGSKSGKKEKGKGKVDNEEEEEDDSEETDKKSVSKGKKPQKGDEKEKTANPEVEAELQAILKRSPVTVFSKSYCPFSKKAKHILGKYTIVPSPHIVELNEHPLGKQLQKMLGDMTGRTTVPNVLINGKSLGGGDDVEALHEKGALAETIQTMAGKRVMEVSLKKKEATGGDLV